jgi:hypothetical protein
MQPRTRSILLRVVVSPVIPVSALVAIELLTFASISMLVAKPDRDDYLYLAGGLLLVACCAAAVKFVFNLSIRYWVVLVLILAAMAILMFAIQARVFLG